MLDVFIRKPFAIRALSEAHTFSQGAVVGLGVRGVEHGDGVPAGDAYWHFGYMAIFSSRIWRGWERGAGACGGEVVVLR